MPRVLPGPPATQKSSKSIALAVRHGQLYLGYITRFAAYIFRDCTELVQIIEEPFATQPIERIAFDRRTGRLALSAGRDFKIYDEVYTFIPRDEHSSTGESADEVNIKWVYGRGATVSGTSIKSLSWGLGGELLVGNDRLSLYHQSSVSGELRSTWDFALASEVDTAIFSPDASLIASHGLHERLVKVWRRLSDRVTSTGAKTSDFDFIYLPHPRLVDDVKWRQPFHEDLLVDNIMYSTSIDQVFRAWASDIPHDSHLLTLHESVSLECDYDSSRKIAVVLDDDVFSLALSKANKRGYEDDAQHKAQQTLAKISSGQPEVVVAVSIDGSIDAYALHNLGNRNDKSSSQQHFFRTAGLDILAPDEPTEHVWITADIARTTEHDLLLFIGRPDSISVYQTKLFDLFSEVPKLDKLATLGGHVPDIENLQLGLDGCLLSKDSSGTLSWRTHQNRLDSQSGTKAADRELVRELDLPQSVASLLTEEILLKAVTTTYSAIVLASQPHKVQIWGEQLAIEFAGAPLSQIDIGESIKAMTWSSSIDDGPVLAVCSHANVNIIASSTICADTTQMWTTLWSFSLNHLTQRSIVDACFLDQNLLAIAAGSQIFTFQSTDWTCSSLYKMRPSGDLPIYHSYFLRQLLRLGKFNAARKILATLHDQLVSSSDEELDDTLGLADEEIFEVKSVSVRKTMNGGGRYSALFGDSPDQDVQDSGILSSSKGDSLKALLRELEVPGLDDRLKHDLSILITALTSIEGDESSLDKMGQQFYLSYSIMRARAQESQSADIPVLSDEDVLWATKSEKQDILLTLVKSSVKSLTWQAAKSARIFRWLKDRAALLEVAETIGRAEFLKVDTRDPVAASIWFHALGKKNTLLSLWRTSGTHPEHNLTTKILNNDFTQPKWKTAANKNAYALVGKRRFQYAAAWFLLAGSLKDAVQLCIRNVDDLDLAFALARIWDNGTDPLIDTLLNEHYLNSARASGSRLLACWTSDFQSQYDNSMRTITTPFGMNTRDTPAILQAYEDLRDRRGASKDESDFIKYIAYLLDTRGCQRLSRYLLRTWDYRKATDASERIPEVITLDQYKTKKKESLMAAPQAVFQEPTMDSFAAFDF